MMTKICIDSGHGGADPGAIGPTGLKEKDVALAVAKQVAELLKPICTVVMTRTTDTRLGKTQAEDLKARVAIAEKNKVELFVSIHCNAFEKPTAKGIETFAYKPGGTGEKLAKAIQTELIKATGLTDRGVKFSYNDIYVVKYTTMPAVLTELGFISNPQEEALLKTSAFRQKAARAIAQGIATILGKKLPEPKPAPAPAQTAPAGKLYKVQVGAYKERKNAEAMLAKLKKAGFDGFIKLE